MSGNWSNIYFCLQYNEFDKEQLVEIATVNMLRRRRYISPGLKVQLWGKIG